MNSDRRSVVLPLRLVSTVGSTRGHRSLGDGDNLSLEAAEKRRGLINDRTSINSRGWNNSTKTSQEWKRKTNENKENTKLPVAKKFQHVQSKLTAPVFSQRRLKQSESNDKSGVFDGAPLKATMDAFNVPAPREPSGRAANAKDMLLPFDHFVTVRSRVQQLPEEFLPAGCELRASSLTSPGSPGLLIQEGIEAQPRQLAVNKDLEVDTEKLQKQLLDAQERLAHLTLARTTDGITGASCPEMAPSRELEPKAQQVEDVAFQPIASASTDVAAAQAADSPVGSTASTALWAQQVSCNKMESSPVDNTTAGFPIDAHCNALVDNPLVDGCPSSHCADGLPGSPAMQCFSSTSAALGLVRTEGLVSLTSCARFLGQRMGNDAPSPGFSASYEMPKFTGWASNTDHDASPAVTPCARTIPKADMSTPSTTPEGIMPSPCVIPSPPEAAFPGWTESHSHQQSAGLSFVSRPVQPVMFGTWATIAAEVEQTPGGVSDVHAPPSPFGALPQQSAGLNEASRMSPATAFDVWLSNQGARAAQTVVDTQNITGMYTSVSPLSSVGPETVSKPEALDAWCDDQEGHGCGVEQSTPAPQVRCNPLFEIDSPASNMSALPERADAYGVLAPTPSPAHRVLPPSLASTPMSDFSHGVCSNVTSPLGRCSTGLSHDNAFAVRSAVAAVHGTEPVVATDTSSPSENGVVAAVPTEVCDAGNVTPKDVPSPDADIMTTAKFVVSPVMKRSACDGFVIGVSVHGMDLDAPTCAQDNSMTASCAASDEVPSMVGPFEYGSPEAVGTASEPIDGSAVRLSRPAAGILADDGSVHSYPNTPSDAWPPSPTTTAYATPLDAFTTPTSLSSLCTALRMTISQMHGDGRTPDRERLLMGSGLSSDFSFGVANGPPGAGGMDPDAPTPVIRLGFPTGALGSNACHMDALPEAAWQPNASFCSPLPIMHLTPVQMRALDHLAGQVLAALSPVRKPAIPEDSSSPSQHSTAAECQHATSGHSQLVNTAAAAAVVSFAQLLANLQSPLPAPVYQRSRFGPTAETAVHRSANTQALDCNSQRDQVKASADGVSVTSKPQATNNGPPASAASPVPNFARLMAFLNAGRRAAVGEQRIQGQCEAVTAGDSSAATTAFTFEKLLSRLHSPQCNQSVQLPGNVAVESNLDANSGHDSPASSEAASFGFSTAAKQMARLTPSTTPGGGMSFVRWARDTGPPTFRLDTDAPHARGMAACTPPTPTSFRFGVPVGVMPTLEDATPTVGNIPPKDHHGLQRSSPVKMLSLHLSPDADAAQSRVLGAIVSPDDHREAPNASSSFTAVVSSSKLNTSAAEFSQTFSFGAQIGGSDAYVTTPMASLGTHGRATAVCVDMDAAQSAVRCNVRDPGASMLRQGSGPALSLGLWGASPQGGDASVGPAHAGQTYSEHGFSFDYTIASLMATPILPGFGIAAAAADLALDSPVMDIARCLDSAIDQLGAGVSPTLFGLDANRSLHDTPGVESQARTSATTCSEVSAENLPADAYAPAVTVLWTALISNLHSPMPAAVHTGTQRNQQMQLKAPYPTDGPPSVDTVLARGLIDVSSTASVPGSEVPPHPGNRAMPPPYEDLPDLIAKGLCLSASPANLVYDSTPTAIAPDTCSIINKNPTSKESSVPIIIAAFDAPAVSAEELERLLHKWPQDATIVALEDSPIALVQSSGYLEVESVTASNNSFSENMPYALCTSGATRTMDAVITESCNGSAVTNQHVEEEELVHCSPVFSFHVALKPSMGAATTRTTSTEEGNQVSTVEGALVPECANPSIASGDSTSCSKSAASECPQPEDRVVSSADTETRLLFNDREDGVAMMASPQQCTEEIVPHTTLSVINVPREHHGTCNSALALISTAAVSSPAQTKRQDGHVGPASPLTFSYLGAGTPPLTPPTVELASTGKGASLLGHSRASPRTGGAGGQFWAPNPSGSSMALGDRVTLKVCNRHIRTNADLLLDFQGSPGHVAPLGLPASVTGAVTPRMKTAGFSAVWQGTHMPSHVSPVRKTWEAVLSPCSLQPTHALAPAPTTDADTAKPALKPKDRFATACSAGDVEAPRVLGTDCGAAQVTSGTFNHAGRNVMETARTLQRAHALQPGQGPPLQQLVATGIEQALATAAATVAQHGGALTSHLPLSHRLGLWPTAAWGIPCNIGTQPVVTRAAPLLKAIEEPQQRAADTVQVDPPLPVPHAAAPCKPALTSRDVQTTPGLAKMQQICENMALNPVVSQEAAGTLPIAAHGSHRSQDANAVGRKPGFRSRIPLPVRLNVPVLPSNSCSTQASASSAAGDTDESNGVTEAPSERVMRRRRLLTCAAAAGGPQRVLVKRGVQRSSVQGAGAVMSLGEEEMRRRAHVLGMRISPYLRTKTSKVRPPEAPKPSKG